MENRLEIIANHNSWVFGDCEKYKSFNCGTSELNDFLCEHSDVELDKQDKTITLAVLGDKVVGFIAYSISKVVPGSSFSDYEGAPHLIVEALGVDENHRGKSYGQLLMLEVIKTTFEIGCLVCLQGIYLTAYKDAVEYYEEKFSFEILHIFSYNNPSYSGIIPMRLGIEAVQDIVIATRRKVTYSIKNR